MVRSAGSVIVGPSIPDNLVGLNRLAANLRWTWVPRARRLLRDIDPELWEATGGAPVKVLNRVSASRLAALAEDQEFLDRLDRELEDLDAHMNSVRWYAATLDEDFEYGAQEPIAALFSLEFGLDSSVQLPCSEEGILAGEHLKAAANLGVPMIGVGLLYTEAVPENLPGSWQGERHARYIDPSDLPLAPVLDENGGALAVQISLPQGETVVRVWQTMVGRVPLLLLDTNTEENPPALRAITARMNPSEPEQRLAQEVLLGAGGVRAVNEWCDIKQTARPAVAHVTDSTAAFVALERVRERMAEGLDYDIALAQVRSGTLFTTTVRSPQDIERYDMGLIQKYLEAGVFKGLRVKSSLLLGAEAEPSISEPSIFNMTYMGIRVSQHANALTEENTWAAKKLFSGLFPGFDVADVPIEEVREGVHIPSWTSPVMRPILEQVGNDDIQPDDVALWKARNQARRRLVNYTRARLHKALRSVGVPESSLGWTRRVLDPDTLTVGLILEESNLRSLSILVRSSDRFNALMKDARVQFVIAGPGSAADTDVKHRLAELLHLDAHRGMQTVLNTDRIVYLPSRDLVTLAEVAAGADVCLSIDADGQGVNFAPGMRAVLNGALLVAPESSWWKEALWAKVGWAIPEPSNCDNRADREAQLGDVIADILVNDVSSLFYQRNSQGIPEAWLAMIRASMNILASSVPAPLMVREYTKKLYLPIVSMFLATFDVNAARGFIEWIDRISQVFGGIQITQQTAEPTVAGEPMHISVIAETPNLDEDDVSVQAIVTNQYGHREIVPLTLNDEGIYTADWIPDRPGRLSYAARVVPHHEFLASDAELGLVAW